MRLQEIDSNGIRIPHEIPSAAKSRSEVPRDGITDPAAHKPGIPIVVGGIFIVAIHLRKPH
jgi:hypothetical protein